MSSWGTSWGVSWGDSWTAPEVETGLFYNHRATVVNTVLLGTYGAGGTLQTSTRIVNNVAATEEEVSG